jgi:hypothetical protein
MISAGILLSYLKKASVWLILILIVAGGYVWALIQRDTIKEYEAELEYYREPVDTIVYQAPVFVTDTLMDTAIIYKYNTQEVLLVDTLTQDSTVVIRETTTGYVEIDTTETGKYSLYAKVFYPSGWVDMALKVAPPKVIERRWQAGIGVGYGTDEKIFLEADVSYKRLRLGVIARDKYVGGFVGVNFY